MKILEICNLYKSFNNNIVLNNVNLLIEKPEIVGIIGGNASGKSVLFKCITGLTTMDQGVVKVLEQDINAYPRTYQQEIGGLIEYPAFIPHYTGFRNLQLLSLFSKKLDKEDIKECMLELGLNPEEKKTVRNYSLGMRQKLGIVAAIMEKQKLILLDEPTNNLDVESVMIVRNIIKKMKRNGSAIIMTSHNYEDIDNLCDRTLQLESGTLIEKERKYHCDYKLF